MKRFSSFKASVGLLAILFVVQGCKKTGGYNSNPVIAPAKEVTLQNSATLGNYLVDKDGRTLYFFGNDADGKNHCPGGCEAVWPSFNVNNINSGNIGGGLSASDFGHVTTASGASQLTYKGWPLYYYAPPGNAGNSPEKPGQTLGDGAFGIWFVGKTDYTVMIVSTQLLGHDGNNYKSDYTLGTGSTTYLSDGKGETLYTFSKDSANHNRFTKSDFSNDNIYPIYKPEQPIVVPSSLDKSDFTLINVFGKTQLTYKGWPLYHFGQDQGVRGSNKGVSFPAPGIWPVPVKDIHAAP